MAGQRVKCPKCQAALAVPAVAGETVNAAASPSAKQAAAPASATIRSATKSSKPAAPQAASVARCRAEDPAFQRQVLAAFNTPIESVDKSVLYPLAGLAVTLVMVVLPLVYIGLIVAVAYGVYAHFAYNHGLLQVNAGLRGRAILTMVYLAPGVIGAIAVLFMIKPLFAPPAKQPRIRSLTRKGEPLLFALVDRICDAVGAPRPARVDIDAQMNASASFRRGLLSMFGSDLVLTIGLPLVAGLNLREFTGVLAHEFGHFSQGMGMRLSYIIRSINLWFARVVYQRDEWDEWLDETASDLDFRIGWVLRIAQICVWISRRVLWCLMVFGHAISGTLSRQMEYDADRWATRLIGGDAYGTALLKVNTLGAGYQLAQLQLGVWHGQGVLADNLSDLTIFAVRTMPTEVKVKIVESAGTERGSLLDTHPNHSARVASIDREETSGTFHVEGRARDLFTHFDEASRGVTWDLYCEVLGPGIRPSDLRAVRDLVQRPTAQAEQRTATSGDFAPIPLAD